LKKTHRGAGTRYLTRVRQREALRDTRRYRHRKRSGRGWRARPARRFTLRQPSLTKPVETIPAPENFDVVGNPEEFIATFDKLEAVMRNGSVPLLDFSERTQTVSSDAILAMVAIATRLARKYATVVRLRWPTDPVLAGAFASSGLKSYLEDTPPTDTDLGMIRRRHNKKVESKTARDLIAFSTRALFGERRREHASYATFIECMGNTFEHSDKHAEGQETWWASINCDPLARKAQCTFVDIGIGIFESVAFKGFVRRMTGAVRKLTSRPQVLRDLLQRKIGSRTGESYRNRGMPKIYADARAGLLQNLIIITDNVYADITRDEFKTMNRRFKGTFYHWEFTT